MISEPKEIAPAAAGSAPAGFGAPWLARLGPLDSARERVGRLPRRRVVVGGEEGALALELYSVPESSGPQVARFGEVGVVFEGALFDRDELQRELGLSSLPPLSDGELVARAVERWGEEAPHRLKGLYAWVAWDRARERLVATRDRLGHVPLFQTETGRERLFATSTEWLLLHPRADRRPHLAYMAERLCWRFYDASETDFRSIFRVPPGHLLIVDRAGERGGRYWDPVPKGGREWIRDDVPARVEVAIRRGVERCLALGPSALFLSGGLDSVNVAALASDACSAADTPLPVALSCAFPGKVSEADIQRGVARRLGLELELLGWESISGGDRSLERVTSLSPEFPLPLLSQWKVAYLRLAEEGVRRGRRVILTGTGGDEWMDMGARWAADLLQGAELRALWRLWRTLDRCYPRPGIPLARHVLWRYGLRPVSVAAVIKTFGATAQAWSRTRKRRYARRSAPTWIAPLPGLQDELDDRAERYLPDPPLNDFLGESTRRFLDSGLDAMQKEEQFESGRRTGVAIVSPLLDPDLVELMLRVPQEVLHRGGMTKALLRDPAVRRFPELGFGRQRKLGATTLSRSFIKEQARATLRGLGGLRRLDELGIVEPAKFETWLEADLRKERSLDNIRIWFALGLESWARSRV